MSYCYVAYTHVLFLAGEWPELLPFLFRWSKSESPHQRESALVIFSQFCAMMGM